MSFYIGDIKNVCSADVSMHIYHYAMTVDSN